ncbi:ATP-binding protein [Amycolatopsis sp. NPDC049252]|uniref:ATP-binding protein n=1 Tax=Amycolatopsis sp. NPDC049252 TaxID=3363933 RepID=UPI0037106A27
MHRHTSEPHSHRDHRDHIDAETVEVAAGAGSDSPIDRSVRASFEELVPALDDEVAALRRQLTLWLEKLPLDPDSGYDITLAAYEALANVVAHAYPGEPGWVRLYADWSGDVVTVAVTDTGCGLPEEPRRASSAAEYGGRGLLLIDKITDQLHVDTGKDGTRVTMIWRPAALRHTPARREG